MEKETVRMPIGLRNDLEKLVEAGWYESRSEAVRDACRRMLEEHALRESGETLTIDFETREQQIRADGGGS